MVSKGIIIDIIIIIVAVLVIWIGLQVAFGTQNPFYVISSISMTPELQVYDIIVTKGNIPFEDIIVGDIIVFKRPSDHERVIVHRVVLVLDHQETLVTKGDANPASVEGTDFPITEDEYIGKVVYTLPQVGYISQLLKPPTNYVLVAIIIGIIAIKYVLNKNENDRFNTT